MNYYIRQNILEIIFSILDNKNIEINDKTTFIEDLGFDSVSIINFMSMIEEFFHISFDDDDNIIEVFYNISNLEIYLEKKTSNER